MVAGRDPQLEKAIEVIVDLLEKSAAGGSKKPQKPSYPDRSDRVN
jgi:hypothetical protein